MPDILKLLIVPAMYLLVLAAWIGVLRRANRQHPETKGRAIRGTEGLDG